jgi:hypothetical protein
MPTEPYTFIELLSFTNTLVSSVVVILAFSLLAYTLTYNFRNPVARRFALLLACVMTTYSADVALSRVITPDSAERWLRFQWIGIAMLPWAYYTFSNAVLRTTNYRTGRRSTISLIMLGLSIASALAALFTNSLVNQVTYEPPISYLEAGPLFWAFAAYFALAVILALHNIWKARDRCLTASSRKRMTYLLLGFVAPGIGVFPYLVGLGRQAVGSSFAEPVFLLSIIGNTAVGVLLVLMSYTVAYFGVFTPDRVVRYRQIRFFTRGPLVAILVIMAIQTIPTVERIFGLPRDIVLFSVITGVIVLSQLILSVTKTLVDRLIYREDRDEIAWLRELDRRLLTTSDLRQFLENNLVALCELLRVPSGFVAAAIGPDLILESVVGPPGVREQVLAVGDWSDALSQVLRERRTITGSEQGEAVPLPIHHEGFWVWPLIQKNHDNKETVLGILGVQARTEAPLFTQDELAVLRSMLGRITLALADRQLQQQVFVTLRRIIPGIDRIQQMRGVVPYALDNTEVPPSELLEPSPIHNPEFEAWVKDALSHYWGGPKLTRSPLLQLRIVAQSVDRADGSPTKALRLVLGQAIERLRPEGKQDLSTPAWLLYNILEMRFIQGRKVREIAERLAMSESDLYRKQRVAIGQVARILTEMEQNDGNDLSLANHVDRPTLGKVNGANKPGLDDSAVRQSTTHPPQTST